MAFNLTAQLNVALNTASLKNAASTINNQLKDVGAVSLGIPKGDADSLKAIRVQAQEASSAMEQFGRQSGLAAKRFAAFTITAGAIIQLTSSLRNALSAAIDFDREMVRLTQVSSDGAGEVSKISGEVTKLATSYGVSSKELINTAVTLKQANLTLKETKDALEALAQAALAPSFDNLKDTTEGAIAIMNQFNISSINLKGALGAVNAVAAEFAVEAQDLIEGVRKAGGAFRSAGGDLNQFLALFTSIRQTTRESAETIGTGLRTIFARIQRNDTVEALKEIGVQLRYTAEEAKAAGDLGLTNQFVGPYEAIKRLSAALNELRSTDPRFSAIVEELGGYRQISKVIPLIQEFTVSQKALGVAQAGSASLAQNAAQAQEAFGVKIQKVAEQFNALVRDITNTSSFRALVDVLLGGASAAIKLADSLKEILPVLTAIAAVKAIQGVTGFAKGFASTAFAPVQGNQPSTLSMSPFLPNIKTKKSDGGFIKMAKGGFVPGSGRGDKIPALLEPGEYVIPRKFAAGALVKAYQVAKKADVVQQRLFDPKSAVTEKDYQSGKFINPNDNFSFLTRFFPISDPVSAKESSPNKKGDMFEAYAANVLNAKRTKASFDVDLIGAGGFPYEVKNEARLSNDEIIASKLARFKSRFNKNAFTNRIDEDTIDLGVIGLVANTANLKGGENAVQKIVEKRSFEVGNVEKEATKNINNPIPKKFLSALAKRPATLADGGLVPGTGNTDSVPLDLPIGSYVIKKSSVNSIGASNLSRLGRAKGGTIPALVMPGEYIYTPDEAKNIGISNLDYMNSTGRKRFGAGGGADDPYKNLKPRELRLARQIEGQLRIPSTETQELENKQQSADIVKQIGQNEKELKRQLGLRKQETNNIQKGLKNQQVLDNAAKGLIDTQNQRARILEESKAKEERERNVLAKHYSNVRARATDISVLTGKKQALELKGLLGDADVVGKQIEEQTRLYNSHLSKANAAQARLTAAIQTTALAQDNLNKTSADILKLEERRKRNSEFILKSQDAQKAASKEINKLSTEYGMDKSGNITQQGKVITSTYGDKYEKLVKQELSNFKNLYGEKATGETRTAIRENLAGRFQQGFFNQLKSISEAKGIEFDEKFASMQAKQMSREVVSGRRNFGVSDSGEFYDPRLAGILEKSGYSATGEMGKNRRIIERIKGIGSRIKSFFGNAQNSSLAVSLGLGVLGSGISPQEPPDINTDADLYRKKSSIGGALTGAATGMAIGSFIPGGALIGGFLGAIAGYTSSLVQADKQIAQVKIDDTLNKLKQNFDIVSTTVGDVNQAIIAKIKDLQSQAFQANRERSIAIANEDTFNRIKFNAANNFGAVGKFFGGDKFPLLEKQFREEQKGRKEILQQQAGGITTLIEKQIEQSLNFSRLGKQNFNFKNVLKDQDIVEQMLNLSLALNKPFDEIKKQFEKFAMSLDKQQNLIRIQEEGIKGQSKLVTSLSQLADAASDAGNSLNNLSPRFQTISDLLSNNTNVSYVRKRSIQAESLGIDPTEFKSSIAEISGGLGQFGQSFSLQGDIIAEIASVLPNILATVNPRDVTPGRDPASEVRLRVQESLKGIGFQQADIQKYVNIIGAKIGEDFEKLLNEAGGDFGELAKRLQSNFVDPFTASFRKIAGEFEAAADKYIDGLNRLTQIEINRGEELDKLARIRQQGTQIKEQISIQETIDKIIRMSPNAARFGLINADAIALEQTSIKTATEAFRKRQEERTGNVGIGMNPEAIGARLQQNEQNLIAAQERLNNARIVRNQNQVGQAEFAAAAQEVQKLKLEANNLNTALKNLADSSELLSATQERISRIERVIADERERNARRQAQVEQTGERLLTSSPEEIQRYQAGGFLTNIAERIRGGLLALNVEQRKLAFQFLDMQGDEGQMRKSVLLQRAGFVAPQDFTMQNKYGNELVLLRQQLIQINKLQERAQEQIILRQESLQARFFEELKAQNQTFLDNLERNFKLIQRGQLGEQQRVDKNRADELKAGRGDVQLFDKLFQVPEFQNFDKQKIFNELVRPNANNISAYLGASKREAELQQQIDRFTKGGAANEIRLKSFSVGSQVDFDKLEAVLNRNFKLSDPSKVATDIFLQVQKLIQANNNNPIDRAVVNQIISDTVIKDLSNQKLSETNTRMNLGQRLGIAFDQNGQAIQALSTGLGKFVLSLQQANITSEIFSKSFAEVMRLGGLIGSNFTAEIQRLEAAAANAAEQINVLNQALEKPKPQANPAIPIAPIAPNVPNNVGGVVAPKPKATGGYIGSSSNLTNASSSFFKPKGTDTVPAILTPGEFVVNAAATAKNYGLLEAINSGKPAEFSKGGPVYLQGGNLAAINQGIGVGGRQEQIDIRQQLLEQRKNFILQQRKKQMEDAQTMSALVKFAYFRQSYRNSAYFNTLGIQSGAFSPKSLSVFNKAKDQKFGAVFLPVNLNVEPWANPDFSSNIARIILPNGLLNSKDIIPTFSIFKNAFKQGNKQADPTVLNQLNKFEDWRDGFGGFIRLMPRSIRNFDAMSAFNLFKAYLFEEPIQGEKPNEEGVKKRIGALNQMFQEILLKGSGFENNAWAQTLISKHVEQPIGFNKGGLVNYLQYGGMGGSGGSVNSSNFNKNTKGYGGLGGQGGGYNPNNQQKAQIQEEQMELTLLKRMQNDYLEWQRNQYIAEYGPLPEQGLVSSQGDFTYFMGNAGFLTGKEIAGTAQTAYGLAKMGGSAIKNAPSALSEIGKKSISGSKNILQSIKNIPSAIKSYKDDKRFQRFVAIRKALEETAIINFNPEQMLREMVRESRVRGYYARLLKVGNEKVNLINNRMVEVEGIEFWNTGAHSIIESTKVKNATPYEIPTLNYIQKEEDTLRRLLELPANRRIQNRMQIKDMAESYGLPGSSEEMYAKGFGGFFSNDYNYLAVSEFSNPTTKRHELLHALQENMKSNAPILTTFIQKLRKRPDDFSRALNLYLTELQAWSVQHKGAFNRIFGERAAASFALGKNQIEYYSKYYGQYTKSYPYIHQGIAGLTKILAPASIAAVGGNRLSDALINSEFIPWAINSLMKGLELFLTEDSNKPDTSYPSPSDTKSDRINNILFRNSGGIVPGSAPNPDPSFFKPRGTDTVPAMLSPGEYVVNAKSTAKYLPLLQNLNNGGPVYRQYGGSSLRFQLLDPYLGRGVVKRSGFNASMFDVGPQGARAIRSRNPLQEFVAANSLGKFIGDVLGQNKNFTVNADKESFEAFGISGINNGSFGFSGFPQASLYSGLSMLSAINPILAGVASYATERAVFNFIKKRKEITSELTGGNKLSIDDYVNLGFKGGIGNTPAAEAISVMLSDKVGASDQISAASQSIQQLVQRGIGNVSADNTLVARSIALDQIIRQSTQSLETPMMRNGNYGGFGISGMIANAQAFHSGPGGSLAGLTQNQYGFNQPNPFFNNPFRPIGMGFGRFFADGGSVGTDKIPAMLTPGEFVVRKDAVNRIGTGFLNRINRYANGGLVQYLQQGGGSVSSSGGGYFSLNFDALNQSVDLFNNASINLSSNFNQANAAMNSLASAITGANNESSALVARMNSASATMRDSAINIQAAANSMAAAATAIPRTINLVATTSPLLVDFSTNGIMQAIEKAMGGIQGKLMSAIGNIIGRSFNDEMRN